MTDEVMKVEGLLSVKTPREGETTVQRSGSLVGGVGSSCVGLVGVGNSAAFGDCWGITRGTGGGEG
jgi:hypothetical protein